MNNNLLKAFKELKENSNDRLEFIDSFLKCCNSNDLFYLNSKLNEYKRDFLTILPNEITELILRYLDWKDLINCCQVSTSWNKKISNDYNSLWKKWCIKILPLNNSIDLSTNEKINYKERFLNVKRHTYSLDQGNEFQTWSILCPAEMNAISSYKNIVATATHVVNFWRLEDNKKWCIFKSLEMISMANDFKFNDEYLIASSYSFNQFSLNLYSLITNQLEHQFLGHTAAITCFDFNQNLICTGSADTTIKIWSIKDKKLLNSESNPNWPAKLVIIDDFIITVYSDAYLYIKKCIKEQDNISFTIFYILDARPDHLIRNNLDNTINLSSRTNITYIDNILTGYFITENNSNELIKFYIKKWFFKSDTNEFISLPFDNSYLDFLNQFSNPSLEIGQYEIITFGFKLVLIDFNLLPNITFYIKILKHSYCLFVDKEDRIYLGNLRNKLIKCFQNEIKHKKNLLNFTNYSLGRKNNFKKGSNLNWLNGYNLNDFKKDSYLNDFIIMMFHGNKMNEIFLITWIF